VPDSAITKSGRLVQCGSCGNKWTQYPAENETFQKTINKSQIKQKKIVKNIKRKKNLYTEEYLKQKHGLVIKSPKEHLINNSNVNKKITENQKKISSFGFYSYMIIFITLIITSFGILTLSKDIIIFKYPATEIYIEYLFETIEIVRLIFTELINQFKN
tara:strand:- start:126 stop:602 length:477 start_codon:yes stop_codon:yes gene_type:complete